MQAAIAAANAGQRPQPRSGWHANADPNTMKPYGFRINEAKAICVLKNNPCKPIRQLLPPPNPPAGAAGDRSDYFPNRPGDVRMDGSRASLIRGWGAAQGMHLQRFSPCGRPTSTASHSAPASWAHSSHPRQLPGWGPVGTATAAHIVPGKVPGAPVAGPMSLREERDANGYLTINLYDATAEQIDVSDIGQPVPDGTTKACRAAAIPAHHHPRHLHLCHHHPLHPSETTTANRKGPSREHFSSVDISRSILENPRAAALHKKSIDNGGKGFTSHWITVKADEGADGVDGLTLANTFTRKWALMTDAEKKRRGLEWVVDLLVQLPDGCTVPRYFDADATPPRSEHYGINEDLASSPKPPTHFAVFYCGVAPEFDMSVEAQEAHGGMFDLSCESGATDALLVPKFKHDKKHGMSMSIWYAPVNGYNVGVGKGLATCWTVNYFLRNIGFRSTSSGLGYTNSRAKMERLSIDAALAHHPTQGDVMAADPRPASAVPTGRHSSTRCTPPPPIVGVSAT